MARVDEATTAATAGEMRDPVAIGFSCCYLIFACERVRDLERAGQWCERCRTGDDHSNTSHTAGLAIDEQPRGHQRHWQE
jgi:hypothetical protein